MLSIRLFGSPQLLLDGQAVNLPRRKSRALVYYLAAQAQPLTRDHLLAFFWPDLNRPEAQQTLRTTLHGLRKALGPALPLQQRGLRVIEDNTLALAPQTEVDVRQFEARLSPNYQLPISESPVLSTLQPHQGAAQSLISALDLYRGDFLTGFTLPDTPAFEDWAAAKREHLRRLFVRGLTTLSQLHEAEANYPAALEALNRALLLDPLQEDVQRAALRLHYLAGDRAGAIRRYEHFRKLLDEEMGVPPMLETRTVYDAIVNDRLEIPPGRPKAPSPPPTASPGVSLRAAERDSPELGAAIIPFTGRTAELAALRSLAAQAQHTLALIEGEPGLGKTRLAEEYLRTAGGIVLAGQARELENALPYLPLIHALRGLLTRPDWPALRDSLRASLPAVWLAEAARLLPELEAGPAAPVASADEARLWEGVYQFLRVLARHSPVILFLDDLHWADASTLTLLGYLLRREAEERASLTFVAAARAIAPRSALATLAQTLTRDGRLLRLPLQRLSEAEIATLAESICPSQAGPLITWLTTASEGNPYILAELVRYAREQNFLRADGTVDTQALTASPLVPQSVYTLIQSRLQSLSEPARRVLDAAVAAGREFDFDVVARASGLSENAALDALDELRLVGLIRPGRDDSAGRLYMFDHTLTMEVAYREVGETRHRLLHRRVAEAMENVHRQQLDAVAGVLASHFAEGNAPERAAAYAFIAGQKAARLAAWTEAIAFYEQALAGEAEVAQRAAILLALGRAHIQVSEAAQAAEALREALALGEAHPNAVDVAEARRTLGQALLMQARYAEVIDIAQTLVNTSSASPIAASGEALWGTALSIEGADLASAAEHLQRAAALLRDESGPVNAAQLAQVTFELGSVAAQQGDLPRAIQLYRDSLATAQTADDEFAVAQRILAHNNLAYHLHLLGEPSAQAHAQIGLRLAQEHGALRVQTYLLSTNGEIALARGDIDLAEGYFTEGLALAERLSVPERLAGLTANLGRVAAQRGQTTLAIHRFSTALARADALGTQHLAAQIRLWLAPLLPPAEARLTLAEARAIAESGGRRRLLGEVEQLERKLAAI